MVSQVLQQQVVLVEVVVVQKPLPLQVILVVPLVLMG
jgi:hypothetical protein